MDERTCPRCAETYPLEQFAKDARKPGGRRYVCKRCDRKATADRRAGRTPKPGALALVLTPKFPTPPEIPSPIESGGPAPTGHKSTEQPGRVGSYAEAAEEFIAALDPPADEADALLVYSLRDLAALADRFRCGLDVVKDTRGLVTDMLRVQRELAATRAARAKPQAEAKPAPRSAANY